MTVYEPERWVARAVLEAQGPLHIGAGRGDAQTDADVVRDMNGLPVLPGTSLAGALRAAFAAREGEEAAKAVFGYQEGAEGRGSSLWVSFGCPLDSQGRAIEGLLDPDRVEKDPVLRVLRTGMVRDHVRIQADGVADAEGRGKFDERLVPSGARFAAELVLSGPGSSREAFETLLSLLQGLRVGGRTRAGLGRLKVVSLRSRRFDFTRPGDVEAYERLSHRIDPEDAALEAAALPEASYPPDALRAELVLTTRSPWGVGRGGQDEEADIALLEEPAIQWNGGQGHVVSTYVLPASSLKGVLAHRVAFHDNCLRGRFADRPDPDDPPRPASENESVQELFGAIKDEGGGSAGRIFLEDVRLPKEHTETDVITHNGLDRWTGGTRSGVLFQERVLRRGLELTTELTIERARGVSRRARQALARTLRDLERGWLQVGHGCGRGNGWLEGELRWRGTAGTEWLKGGAE